MKRTHSTPLIALGLTGLVVGFLVELAATAWSAPIIVPPFTLPLALILIAVILVALAWPIRQATRGRSTKRVDPFLAMRIALLAKASSLSSALLLGVGLGIVTFILTRSVVPAVTSLWLAIGMALGAMILLAGGLVAEHFCTLPLDDHDHDNGGPNDGGAARA
ncbi:DUF3180 domain-containing protein [Cryobacterium adonitolivorans]|uniref:DUF3180 domain-containing protein n=1 Tax=Cryobacterium adonitolivorans TaxID=1259189 RepID=A0A4R8W5P4_9MICO|nr:DUF3180 domain-containing protein [Cryobacterium adonitolivorans]TFC00126.1 DUF3180 domain-containing protein [Cryobacterium adonitolivorans]